MATFKDNWGKRYPKSNFPFERYPDHGIKFLEAQQAADIRHGGLIEGIANRASPYKIYRGYIRNLEPATLQEVTISKCNFQFNPQEIRQSVNMREDIYNPVMLTAEQLSQPIGGTVNFQFDLLFDRSHELSIDKNRDKLIYDQEFGANPNMPPYKLGVFADLKVLYEVIGQGLSEDLVKLQLENIKQTYEAKYKRDQAYSTTPSTTDSTTSTDTTATNAPSGSFDQDFDVGQLSELLKSNYGNAAFLIPNPVRIVFSDLFMVDGFVTGTNVDFLKFNNYMIPMQCRVGVSVNALYIGFAKRKTFLTTTLGIAKQTLIDTNAADTDTSNTVKPVIESVRPLCVIWEDGGYDEDQEGGYITNWIGEVNDPGAHAALSTYLMPDDFIKDDYSNGGQTMRIVYMGFKGIPTSGDDPVLEMYKNLSSTSRFSVTYNIEMSIYGKRNQNNFNGVGWDYAQANTAKSNNTYINTDTVSSKVGFYTFTQTADSADAWGSKRDPKQEKSAIRRATLLHYGSGPKEVPNGAAYSLRFDQYRNAIENSYYVVETKMSISLQTNSITKKDESYVNRRVYKGTDRIGWGKDYFFYKLV